MFNPERLLGQMLGGALGDSFGGKRGRKRRSAFSSSSVGGTAQVGLGLLGVAMAAWEHYGQQNRAGAAGGAPMPTNAPLPGQAMPPPPPRAASALPPASGLAAPPPPPPAANAAATRRMPLLDERQQTVVLLIRTMIAAANADGHIDAQERDAILDRAREGGLDANTLRFLEEEIARPQTLQQVVANTPPAIAAETYAAAALAITVDTDAERTWLDALAGGLRLDPGVRADIDARIVA
jgi:uncharacterized membrane protein YebE (DUF533 family)